MHRYKEVTCNASKRVMGSKKKIVTKIKDALSRGSRSPSPDPGPSAPEIQVTFEHPPSATFAQFLEGELDANELKDDYHKLVTMSINSVQGER